MGVLLRVVGLICLGAISKAVIAEPAVFFWNAPSSSLSTQQIDLSLWLPLMRQDGYVHIIPPVDMKGCTDEDLSKVNDFVTSRQKLHKDGIISKRELIYVYMLQVESLACAGKYNNARYCELQKSYLDQLGKVYENGGKPTVETLPLPGHHLRNLISWRNRCAL